MCGFVGLVQNGGRIGRDRLIDKLRTSAETISHRGPDDAAQWVSMDNQAGFGFRRLSIRDLSVAGRQPMASPCHRYSLVFNGEIYNHEDIRNSLEAIAPRKWRGRADSETLITAISQWGLDETLHKLDGMFAIALWDNRDEKLYLVRDPFGEKPLYFTHDNQGFYFSSELKALPALGVRFADMDRQSIAIYFRKCYIPAPHTIYSNVKKLCAGEIIEYSKGAIYRRKYWNTALEAIKAGKAGFSGTKNDALVEIDRLLSKLTKRRLASDVPLGSFLSGGIDSSLVTALAQAQNASRIKTYTIRFEDTHFNEADEAKKVADHLGTNHTEIMANELSALKMLDRLPNVYDEPFADSSQIPTMLLCQSTRQHVTVALSGDGGDEFFAGYTRYLDILNMWNDQMNLGGRGVMSQYLAGLPWGIIDNVCKIFRDKPKKYGPKIIKGLLKHNIDTMGELSQHTTGFWLDGVPVKEIAFAERDLFNRTWPINAKQSIALGGLKSLMISDAMSYLPDDLMVKVDRASMASSLEVRTPFLNQDLAKLCYSLPHSWHANNQNGLKCLLREALYKYVPSELIDRPKQGFEAPLRQWLRGDFREWGGDLITSAHKNIQDILDMKRIERRWNDHQKGANWEGDLWPALVFLAWSQHQDI